MHTLKYYKHQFIPFDCTLELYFVGCSNGCPGCQNEFLQNPNFEETRELDAVQIVRELMEYVDIAKQVHILGGEPLEQDETAMTELIFLLKKSGFRNIILFTGKNLKPEEITRDRDVFEFVDFVKTGCYDSRFPNTENIPDELTGMVLATTNQKVVVPKEKKGVTEMLLEKDAEEKEREEKEKRGSVQTDGVSENEHDNRRLLLG